MRTHRLCERIAFIGLSEHLTYYDPLNPNQILTEADRCVKCGLCLPHCPTYRLTRDEGDSPRGRIALMQALASQVVESPNLHRHLDRCLGCLACQTACPSGVRYGMLIDAVRALAPDRLSRLQRYRLSLLSRLPYFRASPAMLRLYQQSGLKAILRKIGGARFRRLDNLLPVLSKHPRLQPFYPGDKPDNGRVALFTGCIGRITDQPALHASVRLLTRIGFEVVVPEKQSCCGALHQHNGQPGVAKQLAETNQRAFNRLELDAIVHVATGCGVQLLEYEASGQKLNAPVNDICTFLSSTGLLEKLNFSPLQRKVLIHHPCSSRRLPGAAAGVTGLLRQIPGIDLRALPETGCCGAAGSYLLMQPAMADRLRQPILEQVRQHGCNILVTGNTGCALHLAAGLKHLYPGIEVMHPVQLLLQQLPQPTAH